MQAILASTEPTSGKCSAGCVDAFYLMRQSQEFHNEEVLKKNWDHYAPRTDITYGSSLGPAIRDLSLGFGQSREAYQYFMQAALVDLEDLRGNTADGIHGASAGGVWQAVVSGSVSN